MNSKKKGNRVELEFSKIFTERFKKKFSRCPDSGAFSKRTDEKKFYGDIFCEDEKFKFVIEIKSRKDLTFHQIVFNNALKNFWEQVLEDSKKAKKKPLLIIKLNNKKPFCVVDKNKYFLLKDFLEREDEYFFEGKNNKECLGEK